MKGKLRLIGYPDAAYRNNADNSYQRGQTIFLVEARTGSKDVFGSMIDLQSHEINRVVLSTTVSELLLFHQVLWNLSISPRFVGGYQRRMRGDAYAD